MFHFHTEPSWQQELEKSNAVRDDPLAVIYNEGQWRINKVSPLYNLQYDALKLKQYGTKIRQAIVSNVSTNSATKYTVQFESDPYLVFNEDDAPGLIIKITSTQEATKKQKIAYNAILLSWGVNTNLDNAIYLPYMLDRGEQKLGAIVKTTLQKVFDCQIKQFQFTQNQLLRIGFEFLDHDNSQNQDKFVLVYKTPQVDLKDKLKITFDIGDVRIIWNGVQHEVMKKAELINMAYHILRNQIEDMINLDIAVLQLNELLLPKAEVKSGGIVKMKTPQAVNSLFTALNNMCDANLTDLSLISQ